MMDRRILIVDDEESNVVLLERLLRNKGYTEITTTRDSSSAEALCRAVDPDILLLDLHMPSPDGFEVMEQLTNGGARGPAPLPILVLTADTTPETRERALSSGASDFVTKPFDGTEVLLRVRNLLQTRWLHLRLEDQNETLERQVEARTTALKDALARLQQSAEQLALSRSETIRRLSRAVEYRDNETGDHIERMSQYCGLLAERLGLDSESILIASPMHDVGKIAIRDDVLRKEGRLTPEERLEMQRHAEVGHELLSGSSSELLQLAATIAWTHHERYDGGGYPRGLAGDAIPIEGRIAGVADVFDALTSDRVYRPAFAMEDALEMMREERGAHFDPAVLDAFLTSLDEVTAIRERYGSALANAPAGASAPL